MKISASFLGIKENLKENVNKLINTEIDYLHLDIMDGIFVSNKSESITEIKKIITNKKPLDIHLMVEDVIKYIDLYKAFNPEYITFHVETKCDIMNLVKYIKDLNIKVGLSIKPKTNIETLIPYLPFIDLILIMSVEPGYGGQSFINITDKIDKLVKLKGDYDYLISVDGGINNINVKEIKSDIIVVGSYITDGDYEQRIESIKKEVN